MSFSNTKYKIYKRMITVAYKGIKHPFSLSGNENEK